MAMAMQQDTKPLKWFAASFNYYRHCDSGIDVIPQLHLKWIHYLDSQHALLSVSQPGYFAHESYKRITGA